MMRCRVQAIAAIAILLVGCSGNPGPSTSRGETTSTAAPSPPTAAPKQPLRDDGLLIATLDSTGDASRVTSLVEAPDGAGERFVIGFARDDGLPAARVGPVRVELVRALGIVRVHLAKRIQDAAVEDQSFEGALARAAYVVHTIGDSLVADLHLGAAARARASALTSPALVVVEVESGGAPLGAGPTRGAHVVVLAPSEGTRLHYPFEISGYARTFEANVVAELRRNGQVVAKTSTTAAGGMGHWGEFRLRFESGPAGKLQLFVGDYSPKDGSEDGVRINIEAP